MDIKSTDLVSLFESALQDVSQEKLEEIGIVIQVGDGICKMHGLTNAMYGELINFEGGNRGIIMQLEEDSLSLFLLDAAISVAEGEVGRRTGSVFKAPVGMGLLGRVINAIGKPIDGLGDLIVENYMPVEACVPGIIERSPIDESLETGILAIDALIPIGKGQRELLIGNRDSGKTTVVLDIILHQKDKNVLCVYVAIGQRVANLARMVRLLEENGALEYTVIVSAAAGQAALNQYLAPYVGCTIGEYLRSCKRDVLIIYDDLSSHAIAYREMALLLRQSPGREAYPGDVFYLHSRLLERAGKLAVGGSLTALPIVQIQSDDITSYIATNLISITDGQIFLDTKLFNQGIRPAVNTGLSISRVGGAAQTQAIKKVTKALRLELAQYYDLLDFAQFGTELDDLSKKRLERGALVVELLKQDEHVTYSFVDQSLMLFLLKENFLDPIGRDIGVDKVRACAIQFASYVKSVYKDLYMAILTSKTISDDNYAQLKLIAQEFSTLFVVPKD